MNSSPTSDSETFFGKPLGVLVVVAVHTHVVVAIAVGFAPLFIVMALADTYNTTHKHKVFKTVFY